MSTKTNANCSRSFYSGYSYFERTMSRYQKVLGAHMNVYGLMIMIGLIKTALTIYENPWQWAQNQIDITLFRNDFDWWSSGFVLACAAASQGSFLYATRQDNSNPIDKKVATKLSRAIQELSKACFEDVSIPGCLN